MYADLRWVDFFFFFFLFLISKANEREKVAFYAILKYDGGNSTLKKQWKQWPENTSLNIRKVGSVFWKRSNGKMGRVFWQRTEPVGIRYEKKNESDWKMSSWYLARVNVNLRVFISRRVVGAVLLDESIIFLFHSDTRFREDAEAVRQLKRYRCEWKPTRK